ncbi:hypothetical protein QE152_g15594 [Popillia japonica]|uniref:Uncharacterized protein n=1 Tax=Popillia japonica TaxID=7064 RepID=A0AAW1L7I8_POPJA
MNIAVLILCSAVVYGTFAEPKPYYFGTGNPYVKIFGRIEDLYSPTGGFPVLNVLAEIPHTIGNTFTVVPMVVVSKESMKMITKGEIMIVSKNKPEMLLKSEHNNILRCTPAVKVILDTPIVVYSLKSNIVFPSQIEIVHEGYRIPIKVGSVVAPVTQDIFVSFPSQIEIVHEGYRIPIKVGSVVAPVTQDIFVSADTPISLSVIYAIPSDPVKVDYVHNYGVALNVDSDSVIVESPVSQQPPKNITVFNFPDAEAEPNLQVDEENEDLDNRNPPIVLAPAGIVQSTQPLANVQPFFNSKESYILTELREESKKRI